MLETVDKIANDGIKIGIADEDYIKMALLIVLAVMIGSLGAAALQKALF